MGVMNGSKSEFLVAVIIPTLYSNPQLLHACLSALSRQKVNFSYHVFLVANGCDVSGDILNEKLVSVIKLPENRGFAGAVNAGIEASNSKFVVLLNDDAVPDSNWLTELVQTQLTTKADMVASTIYLSDGKTLDSQGFGFLWRGKAVPLVGTHEKWQSMPDYWLNNLDFLPRHKNSASDPFGPDAAAALYTRHLFNKVGLFRNDFFAYLEDVELALRARKFGMVCALANEAVVRHHKHATSTKMPLFKVSKDVINWWKIVVTFPLLACFKFLPLIFLERIKNLKGYMQAWLC